MKCSNLSAPSRSLVVAAVNVGCRVNSGSRFILGHRFGGFNPLSVGFGGEGEGDVDGCALTFGADEREFALVALDEALHHQQADAAAGNLGVDGVRGAVVEVEQAALLAGGNADACVAYGQLPMSDVERSLQLYAASFRRVFQRVAQQVPYDGIHLVAVHPHPLLRLGGGEEQRDVAHLSDGAEVVRHLREVAVQAGGHHVERLLVALYPLKVHQVRDQLYQHVDVFQRQR